ncbi:Cyclin-dependent kinases regulatory subunit, partial [Colletotrichum shisoi]
MDIDMSRRNKVPRPLSESERTRLDEFIESIHYSARYVCPLAPASIHALRSRRKQRTDLFALDRYSDSEYEYRHVQLPKAMLKAIPKDYHDSSHGTLKLLWEEEWRALGITQSLGWEHYEVHEPEPHILLF